MQQTSLHDRHVELGAKMVDFAGWHMPVQYTSIIEEHKTVRNNVGLFDVSHMGEVVVEGNDALIFLNSLVPQELSNLTDGKAIYCQLTNTSGGIIDDLIIYKINNTKYFIVFNASRVDIDVDWLQKNKSNFNVEIINKSNIYSLIAVQGPKSIDLMEKLGCENLPPFFSIAKSQLKEIDLWISRTGYTGEDGVELLIKNEDALTLWNLLLEAGQEFGIKPIGLGARDTLRLEAALHLYGNDLDETTTPIEAGLSWSVSKTKTSDYNGKEVIFNQIKNGVSKKLVGLKMLDRNIARHGYDIYYNNDKIGIVTSGGISPMTESNIAMAYIKNIPELQIGSVIQVKIRDKFHDAQIVTRPFINKRNKS